MALASTDIKKNEKCNAYGKDSSITTWPKATQRKKTTRYWMTPMKLTRVLIKIQLKTRFQSFKSVYQKCYEKNNNEWFGWQIWVQ